MILAQFRKSQQELILGVYFVSIKYQGVSKNRSKRTPFYDFFKNKIQDN